MVTRLALIALITEHANVAALLWYLNQMECPTIKPINDVNAWQEAYKITHGDIWIMRMVKNEKKEGMSAWRDACNRKNERV